MSSKIIFDGKEYDSPDALPPALRKRYDDLIAGDRTYNSRDALPAELREFVERARAAAAKGEAMPRVETQKKEAAKTPGASPDADLPRWQGAGSLKWLVLAAVVAASAYVWLHWAPGS